LLLSFFPKFLLKLEENEQAKETQIKKKQTKQVLLRIRMPIPFHLSGCGKSDSNQNMSNASVLLQSGDDIEISQDDPSKIFTELTEIGHGNFGAVYYVIKPFNSK
jgi:hypothetical protein